MNTTSNFEAGYIMTKILILESNKDFAEEMSNLFCAETDVSVCGVTDDGAVGLQWMETYRPDVVLVGLILKSVDGFSVLERGVRAYRNTSFFVLGNYSDERVVSRTVALGAKYYFMKPVSASAVLERIMQYLSEDGAVFEEGVKRKRVNNLDERISNIFITIGIPPHIKGYNYLREGIKMVVEEPLIINNITKGLYPMIGERFQTSASKVERAIRHAIEVAWNRGRIDAVNAIFGARVYIGTEKPTNSEFIALVADKLILENMA